MIERAQLSEIEEHLENHAEPPTPEGIIDEMEIRRGDERVRIFVPEN